MGWRSAGGCRSLRTRSSTARTCTRIRSHEERSSCACSCSILWPMTFTGVLGVQKAAAGSGTSLSDLRHRFWWHLGPVLKRCGQALVETMLPFVAPLAGRVGFEAVSFEVFWP